MNGQPAVSLLVAEEARKLVGKHPPSPPRDLSGQLGVRDIEAGAHRRMHAAPLVEDGGDVRRRVGIRMPPLGEPQRAQAEPAGHEYDSMCALSGSRTHGGWGKHAL